MNDFARSFLNDCQDISSNILTTGQSLYDAIRYDIEAKRRLRDAEERLSNYEAELIAEATIRASVEKSGPLAGIAATSSAFKAACEALIAKSRRTGSHAQLYAEAVKLRNEGDECTALREGVAVTFSALKHAADLRAAMLHSLQG